MSILAQHSNYKRAYFGSTDDRIVHKKFQRFQKWVQMLLKTSIKVVSRHSCQDTSVAISQFSHVRIWWYIAHFDPFNVLIHLHLISWMGKVMHLRANCVHLVNCPEVVTISDILCSCSCWHLMPKLLQTCPLYRATDGNNSEKWFQLFEFVPLSHHNHSVM